MSKRLSLLLLVSALTALPFGIARAGDTQAVLEVRNVTSRDLSVILSGLCTRELDLKVMVRAGSTYQRPFLVDQECMKHGHATVQLTIDRWTDRAPRPGGWSPSYVSFHFQGGEQRLTLDVHSLH